MSSGAAAETPRSTAVVPFLAKCRPSPTSLARLPFELRVKIVRAHVQDLLSKGLPTRHLLLVCTEFYDVVAPHQYPIVFIPDADIKILLELLRDRILPRYGAFVKGLDLLQQSVLSHSSKVGVEEVFAQVLRQMPNLVLLVMSDYPLHIVASVHHPFLTTLHFYAYDDAAVADGVSIIANSPNLVELKVRFPPSHAAHRRLILEVFASLKYLTALETHGPDFEDGDFVGVEWRGPLTTLKCHRTPFAPFHTPSFQPSPRFLPLVTSTLRHLDLTVTSTTDPHGFPIPVTFDLPRLSTLELQCVTDNPDLAQSLLNLFSTSPLQRARVRVLYERNQLRWSFPFTAVQRFVEMHQGTLKCLWIASMLRDYRTRQEGQELLTCMEKLGIQLVDESEGGMDARYPEFERWTKDDGK